MDDNKKEENNENLSVTNDEKEEKIEHGGSKLYYSDLEAFQLFCNSNEKSKTTTTLTNDTMLLCSKLSNWIYKATKDNSNDSIFMKSNHIEIIQISLQHKYNHQCTQWALLSNNIDNTLYLVFKGTNFNDMKDILSDTGVKPHPIFFDNDNKPEISGFGGIYGSVIRDFKNIWSIINKHINSNNKIYITGHSYGGGLSILFGIESIKESFIPNKINSNNINIITFGAPTVISLERNFDKLQKENQNYLKILHSITHCMVNRFDIIPHIPMSTMWIKNIVKLVLNDAVLSKINSTTLAKFINVTPLKNAVPNDYTGYMAFEEKINNAKTLLNSYEPFGQYYFFFSNYELYYTTNDRFLVQKLFDYLPKHATKMIKNSRYISNIIDNHSAVNYIELFQNNNIKNKNNTINPKLWLNGYNRKIKGKDYEADCTSGSTWWDTVQTKKYKHISYHLQTHKVNTTWMKEIRSIVPWSHHTYQSRIIYKETVGSNTIYKEIAASNNITRLREKMKSY